MPGVFIMCDNQKVFECDYCGTMLEEGDDYRNVLAKLGTGLIVSLRFCCPECVKKYVQEHSDGAVFNLPIMMSIDHIPGLTNHDFIEWRYLESKDVMRYLNNNLGPAIEQALNESDVDPDDIERQSWDTEDYSDDPDQESCTWGNCNGVADYEDASYDYDEEDGPEDDDNDIWEG